MSTGAAIVASNGRPVAVFLVASVIAGALSCSSTRRSSWPTCRRVGSPPRSVGTTTGTTRYPVVIAFVQRHGTVSGSSFASAHKASNTTAGRLRWSTVTARRHVILRSVRKRSGDSSAGTGPTNNMPGTRIKDGGAPINTGCYSALAVTPSPPFDGAVTHVPGDQPPLIDIQIDCHRAQRANWDTPWDGIGPVICVIRRR